MFLTVDPAILSHVNIWKRCDKITLFISLYLWKIYAIHVRNYDKSEDLLSHRPWYLIRFFPGRHEFPKNDFLSPSHTTTPGRKAANSLPTFFSAVKERIRWGRSFFLPYRREVSPTPQDFPPASSAPTLQTARNHPRPEQGPIAPPLPPSGHRTTLCFPCDNRHPSPRGTPVAAVRIYPMFQSGNTRFSKGQNFRDSHRISVLKPSAHSSCMASPLHYRP